MLAIYVCQRNNYIIKKWRGPSFLCIERKPDSSISHSSISHSSISHSSISHSSISHSSIAVLSQGRDHVMIYENCHRKQLTVYSTYRWALGTSSVTMDTKKKIGQKLNIKMWKKSYDQNYNYFLNIKQYYFKKPKAGN